MRASRGGDYDPRTPGLCQGKPWDSEGQGHCPSAPAATPGSPGT